MDEIVLPFVRLWDWVDRSGGYPGKILFVCAAVMLVVGGLTWYGNKR